MYSFRGVGIVVDVVGGEDLVGYLQLSLAEELRKKTALHSLKLSADMPLLLLSCAFSEVQDANLLTQDSSPWRKEYHLTPPAPPGAWVFTNSTNCGDGSPCTVIL